MKNEYRFNSSDAATLTNKQEDFLLEQGREREEYRSNSSDVATFNLSEKIQDEFGDRCCKLEDVKEFIRKETSLLSDLLEKKITWGEFDEKRAKLAGERLI